METWTKHHEISVAKHHEDL
ncbi:hypothetical protein RDI58_015947 [Solanum bulbocastanum]